MRYGQGRADVRMKTNSARSHPAPPRRDANEMHRSTNLRCCQFIQTHLDFSGQQGFFFVLEPSLIVVPSHTRTRKWKTLKKSL
jgi:hypothetical protein